MKGTEKILTTISTAVVIFTTIWTFLRDEIILEIPFIDSISWAYILLVSIIVILGISVTFAILGKFDYLNVITSLYLSILASAMLWINIHSQTSLSNVQYIAIFIAIALGPSNLIYFVVKRKK